MELRVWAPAARSLAVVSAAGRTELERRGEDWCGQLAPGTDYRLSVDGGPPLPDPRSVSQPHGVHGPSRAVDLADFPWTDGAWRGREMRGALWYELHVGTFTAGGTLDAAIARLDHLADLGVGVVELMPLAEFPGNRGWGYDGVDLFAVHHSYGGPRALQRFVDAAHARGVAVALDVVYNHLGPDGNYLSQFGPYFTDAFHTPWGEAVNLSAPGVRRFILDNARHWFKYFHIDALRLDAVHALHDPTDRHILAELSEAARTWQDQLGRPLALVAESDLNQPCSVASTAAGGWGLTGQWDDDVHHALHANFTGETQGYYTDFGTPEVLAHVMEHVFWHDGRFSPFRGRVWGAPVPDDVDRARFWAFTQNHDQVGNRALGDRPDLPTPVELGQLALLLLSPFTPMLFQGQEWGTRTPFQYFTDHNEELGRLVTAGRRREFGGWAELHGGTDVPDPQDPATFARSVLDWSEVPRRADFLHQVRQLVELRGQVAGDAHVRCAWGQDWFALGRSELSVYVTRRTHAFPTSARTVLWSCGGEQLHDGALHLPGPGAAVVPARLPNDGAGEL